MQPPGTPLLAQLATLARYLTCPEDGRACPPSALAGPLKAALWALVAVLAGVCLGQLR